MSQTQNQVHKLSIKQKIPGRVLSGANAEITLDGAPLLGLTYFKLEIKPQKLAKVILEVLVELDAMEVDVQDLQINPLKK